jgi:hypothetical protein
MVFQERECSAARAGLPGGTVLQGNRYFAKDSLDAFERERLAVLTRIADPITTRCLTDLGPGWRCLDVGAGDGSVARWLAGRVVATDLNPRFLAGHGLPRTGVGSTPPPDGAAVWRAA